jgi:hypothetical protein
VNSLNIPFVDLTHEEMSGDIERFVFESLEHPRFSRTLLEGKDLIREDLVNRAYGMYGLLSFRSLTLLT